MGQTIIITAISILLSGIFSWFLAKRSNRRHRIVHFVINSFDIGKGLSNDFPEFKLTNESVELSNNVMVLKGGFINVSTKDIGETDKIMVFQIALPKGCVVNGVKIRSKAKDLLVKSQEIDNVNNNRNIIPFCINGIFKDKEFFEYTAIVEIPVDMNDLDYKQFEFRHRITNTDIENTYLGPEKSPMLSFFSNGISMVVKDIKASFFGLLTTIAIDALIIVVIVRGEIFDVLGITLFVSCGLAILFYLIAFVRILLLVKSHNHIVKNISKETDA